MSACSLPGRRPPPDFPPNPILGTEWQNPVDFGTYVYIPGDGELEPFWIMTSEVTVANVRHCTLSGPCPDSFARYLSPDYSRPAGLMWPQAERYARWVGGRLPTVTQWQRACHETNIMAGIVRDEWVVDKDGQHYLMRGVGCARESDMPMPGSLLGDIRLRVVVTP